MENSITKGFAIAQKEAEKRKIEIMQANSKLIDDLCGFDEERKEMFFHIISKLKNSITYKLNESDIELINQYCELKFIHDKSWREYNLNPERYVRIVTGICSDGKTPKVLVKENEHYKTWIETGKQLEKILEDLRLTPEIRHKK